MQAAQDEGPSRVARGKQWYQEQLDHLKATVAEWNEQRQYKARLAAEAEADRLAVAIPAEHLLAGWDWCVSFEVYKPKKRKKLWHDIAQLTAGGTPGEVRTALDIYCRGKGWQLRQLYGAKPVTLAYAIDRRDSKRPVTKGEERLIRRPAAFGQPATAR